MSVFAASRLNTFESAIHFSSEVTILRYQLRKGAISSRFVE